MPAYNRNKINPGILRYPLDAFEEDTDYLRINTVDYKPPGLGSRDVNLRLGIEESEQYKNAPPSIQRAMVKMNDQYKIQNIDGSLTSSYTRSGKYRNEELTNKEYKSSKGTVFLPIPSNIQDGNSVKYTEGELDGLTAQVLDFAVGQINQPNTTITSINDIGPIISSFLKEGSKLVTTPAVYNHIIRSLAAQAANIPFGGNLTASQLLARGSGNIVNPNMELLFDGVTLRTFKFSFKMTPRGKDEMEHVKSIIRHFKKSMSPSSTGSGDVYLSTPKVFELSYMKGNKPHPFLHRFKPCALTDCSVNYTGEANYATYQDGTPVSMVMDLGFKELEPIYADDYTDPKSDRYNLEGPVSDTDPIYGGVGY